MMKLYGKKGRERHKSNENDLGVGWGWFCFCFCFGLIRTPNSFTFTFTFTFRRRRRRRRRRKGGEKVFLEKNLMIRFIEEEKKAINRKRRLGGAVVRGFERPYCPTVVFF